MTEKAHLERKILLEINQKKKTTQETNAIVHLTDHSFIFLIRFRSMKPMNTCAQVDRHYFLFPTESINFTVHIRFSLFFYYSPEWLLFPAKRFKYCHEAKRK